MKKRVLLGFMFFVAFAMIISGFSLDFLAGYQMDKAATLASLVSIDQQYQDMRDYLEVVREKILSMQDFFDLFYEQVPLYQEKYQGVMEEISNSKMQIDQNYQNLKQRCLIYTDQDRESKCQSVKDNYDSFVDTYTELQNTYQQFLENYSNWNQEHVYAFQDSFRS